MSSNLPTMQSPPEESVCKLVYPIFVQSDDPNVQGYNVWFNQNHMPFDVVPLYPVAQNVTTTTPTPLNNSLSAAQLSFDSGANPQGNIQPQIFYTSVGQDTPTDPGLSTHRYSTITSPSASSAPSPGPSTLLHNPRRYHCPSYRPEVQEASGSQARPSPRHRCEWKDCADTKGFRSLHVLARHVSEQHIKETIKCPNPRCQKEFKRPYMLKQHLSNHHNTARTTTAHTSTNSSADSYVFPSDTSL